MPREVPKKNISRIISDVFGPRDKGPSAATRLDAGSPSQVPPPPLITSAPIGKVIGVFIGLSIVAGAAFIAYSTYVSRARISEASAIAGQFGEGVSSLRSFDFGSARDTFTESQGALGTLLGTGGVDRAFGILGTLVKGAGTSYADLWALSGKAVVLASDLDQLGKNGLQFATNGGGGEIIRLLGEVRDTVAASGEAIARLNGTAERLRGVIPMDPGGYLDIQIVATRAKNFLDNFIPWLKGERRIIVFFYNPSELRPGGGFLGSYADVTLSGGSIRTIDVHDINDPDRELERLIVPPHELQGVVKRWRAADANWFFDFPSSAEKTLSLLESSKFYADKNIKFDGAIAVLPRAVSDLLARTGPITLSSGLTVDKDNFVYEIQEEVQAGQVAKADAPKAILTELTPRIMEALSSSSSTAPDAPSTIGLAQKWFLNKDAMLYLREDSLQNFLESAGIAGNVFEEPDRASGEYLAIVNSNIGGAKTDLFMAQEIMLQSQVGNDGIVSNHLIVTRTHHGDEAKSWWYREPNQNYLKVFTPLSSHITAASGTILKTIKPSVDYAKGGYEIDSDLAALEGTVQESLTVPKIFASRESGKSVFAAWTRTELGKTSELTMDYERHLISSPEDGDTYTVVLEKQAGTTGKYSLEIAAPVGFRWKENGLPVFEYETDDLPARLLLNLTFEKVV